MRFNCRAYSTIAAFTLWLSSQRTNIMLESSSVLIGVAPAKINLFFEVLGKRPDGYHNVFSLCVPVNLYDTLFFLPNSSGTIRFSVENGFHVRYQADIMKDMECIPEDHNNLVVRALELVRKTFHITKGVDVVLIKRIPSCAGLGGGSSDAATSIMMADRMWNLKQSRTDLMKLGAELGSDVPLFFTPGYSLGGQRGEVVRSVKSSLRLDLVIVKPPGSVKTKDAFDWLDQNQDVVHSVEPDSMIKALERRNPFQVGRNLWNRLESAVLPIHPEIERIRKFLGTLDCPGVLMSGSGTACYGICRNRNHAEHVAANMKNFNVGVVFPAHTILDMNRLSLISNREQIIRLD